MKYKQTRPASFDEHVYSKKYIINSPVSEVWNVLMRESTFRDTQLWPFRVEFDSDGAEDRMTVGMDNVHHGPLMLFTGVLTEIREREYRDLHYYLGSYFLSVRWIRPARLEFFVVDQGDNTGLELRLTTYVRPWIKGIWNSMLSVFWLNFGSWFNRYVKKQIRRA
ncbi:hypothetical protein [Fulvivirga sedimenti]|uniref:SRPBCC family protein n=1 Tax=Fulvivirga sedimenti TaxID=2879465 RepID=A0A9X1HVB5_9BACT|nr:hypothetical protein [Fulvivirga sedimenti]MCA6074562.1 hypothetical protein [Fulvivirga sedimenti]MCA6075739.1 hypothetical protein [Fulvivirga sedimenti]MCA6076867.1 hypothetical protein [Fulvivirga sedimenti]